MISYTYTSNQERFDVPAATKHAKNNNNFSQATLEVHICIERHIERNILNFFKFQQSQQNSAQNKGYERNNNNYQEGINSSWHLEFSPLLLLV